MKPLEESEALGAVSMEEAAHELEATESLLADPDALLREEQVAALLRFLGADRKAVRRRAAEALATAARRDAEIAGRVRARLRDSDPAVRFGAAYALVATGDGPLGIAAAPALYEALGDPDGDIRWAASEAIVRLGRLNSAEIGNGLIELALDQNSRARKMALYCIRDLGLAGDPVLAVAANASRSDDTHLRLAAISVLARLNRENPKAAELTLERLEQDGDDGVRRAAAAALGNVAAAGPLVLEALRRAAAHNSDRSLARAAQAALERLSRS